LNRDSVETSMSSRSNESRDTNRKKKRRKE
jgi:hypothetical protein